mmetsp:Transcript_83050/g.173861  ORF Transcript_83050/g.173861 Transcript_83050/m.173861 type:complete len:476 (+) Transcript_83050:115-1542(+)
MNGLGSLASATRGFLGQATGGLIPGTGASQSNATNGGSSSSTSTAGGFLNSSFEIPSAQGLANSLGLSSALGWAPGAAPGDPASEVAISLTNAFLELMIKAPKALEGESQQAELADHIDKLLACRSLVGNGGIAACLLEYWYALRSDALSRWPVHRQQTWVQMAYVVKYADLGRAGASRVLTRCVCGLLLELGDGFRESASTLDTSKSSAWTQDLLRLAAQVEVKSPPVWWGFPGLTAVVMPEPTGDPRIFMMRSDDRVYARKFANGKGVAAALCCFAAATAVTAVEGEGGGGGSSSSARGPRPMRSSDEDEVAHAADGDDSEHRAKSAEAIGLEEMRALTGSYQQLVEDVCPLASGNTGAAALAAKCTEKGDRVLVQKTQPIHFINQASMPLKICLFTEDDPLCAIPVGGIGGSCVVILGPGIRAQLRPPGLGKRFQLKVLEPHLMDTLKYKVTVERNMSVQLRSHECSIDRAR